METPLSREVRGQNAGESLGQVGKFCILERVFAE
jgi:hypothetical protein